MDRAYYAGAAQSPPAAPSTPSIGYPSEGNPASGVPATRPGPFWYHMLTEELTQVVLGAGITPSHTNTQQLLAAVRYFARVNLQTLVTTGAGGSYAATHPELVNAYSEGQKYKIKFHAASTGQPTLNVNGLGAKQLKQYASTGAKVAAVVPGQFVAEVEYDGVDFVVVDALPPLAAPKPPYAVLYPAIRAMPKAKAPLVDMVALGDTRRHRFAAIANNELSGSINLRFIADDLNYRALDYSFSFSSNVATTLDLSAAPSGEYAFVLATRATVGASQKSISLKRFGRALYNVTDFNSVTYPVSGENCGAAAALVAQDDSTAYFATTGGTNILVRKISGSTMTVAAELSISNVQDLSLTIDASGDLYMLVCITDAMSQLYKVTNVCTLIGATETSDFKPIKGVLKASGNSIYVAQVGKKVDVNDRSFTAQKYTMPGFVPTTITEYLRVDDAYQVKADIHDGSFYAAAVSPVGGAQIVRITSGGEISRYAYAQSSADETIGLGLACGNNGLGVLLGSKKAGETTNYTANPVEFFAQLG